jgi:hypothetical protein
MAGRVPFRHFKRVGFQVCHLTKSIGEMESSLKAAREKEKMMSEEM